jgi:hypothetical protein
MSSKRSSDRDSHNDNRESAFSGTRKRKAPAQQTPAAKGGKYEAKLATKKANASDSTKKATGTKASTSTKEENSRASKKPKMTANADSSEAEKENVNKEDMVNVEDNRKISDDLREIGKIYFKNKDRNARGGVFSNAAKAIRESNHKITSGKEAEKLHGIGHGIAGYIDEKLKTGKIGRL